MNWQRIASIFPLALALVSGPTLAEDAASVQAWQSYLKGDYEQSINHFSRSSASSSATDRIGLGLALQQVGKHRLATTHLEAIRSLFLDQPDHPDARDWIGTVELATGISHLHLRRMESAKESFDRARDIAADTGNKTLESHALINKALYYSVRNTRPDIAQPDLSTPRDAHAFKNLSTLSDNLLFTQATLEEALSLASDQNKALTTGEVRLAMARSHLRFSEFPEAADDALEAERQWNQLPPSDTRNRRLISTAEILIGVAGRPPSEHLPTPKSYAREARRILAELLSSRHPNPSIEQVCYIKGYLSDCALILEEPSLASQHNRDALLLATSSNDPIPTFLWQWQKAQIAKATGKSPHQILQTYAAAFRTLVKIQRQLSFALATRTFGNSLRERIGPFFQQYATQQLQAGASEPRLEAVITLMEQAKIYELNNYFLTEDCEAILKAQAEPITSAHLREAALVYYLVTAERLYLIIRTSAGAELASVKLSADDLNDSVTALHTALGKITSNAHPTPLKALYAKLIQPIYDKLGSRMRGIRTLVFVPDGILRSVPMAALIDTEGNYLIEKKNISVLPSLQMFVGADQQQKDGEYLLAGLSAKVQRHTELKPLKAVRSEIANIHQLLGKNGTVLEDEAFTWPALERHLRRQHYQTVHLATHAAFFPTSSQGFLVAHDRDINIPTLSRSIERSLTSRNKINLLVLSACQTAAGDDQAILGIAGTAFRAGARSTIASLWNADDNAAAMLMTEFYRHYVSDRNPNKAAALAAAQRHFINLPPASPGEPDYQHPAYWSSFQLIGDWQ